MCPIVAEVLQSPLIQGPILSHYRCGPTAERLGHLSAQITLDTYSHLLPGVRKEAAKAFDDALGTSRKDR
jgi:hypothetical protein